MIQSYAAYTPNLLRLNDEFYNGPAAPQFVLMQWLAIDGRVPAQEDARLLLTPLRNTVPNSGKTGTCCWHVNASGRRS